MMKYCIQVVNLCQILTKMEGIENGEEIQVAR